MRLTKKLSTLVLLAAVSAGAASAQEKMRLGNNAALRYWSAFAQMQDAAITDADANELNQILKGTAPYADSKYRELVEKNRPALETMARGTAIKGCDWGIEYKLGADAPVEYARQALSLGRLNVLYALHLLQNGDKEGMVRTVVAGVRFSRDVAGGGTLFATLVAKGLLVEHLRVIDFAIHVEGLSTQQKQSLGKCLAPLGPEGLEWRTAMKRELETLRSGLDSSASQTLDRITPVYLAALDTPAQLPRLKDMIAAAPQSVQERLPNPERVTKEREDLFSSLSNIRSSLR
jgi:hypothetical protein